jgi:hypothetical protein
VADRSDLFDAYELLILSFGWTLQDARALTAAERSFFLSRTRERVQRRNLESML